METKSLIETLSETFHQLAEKLKLERSQEISDDPKFQIIYEEKQLMNIRENWKVLSYFMRIFLFLIIIVLGLTSKNSSIFMIRTTMLVAVILFLSVFQGIVEKSEMAAKYSGTILSIIVIFGITEINVNLGQYRLYEAFMGQIALSFLMSTCMSTDWIAATLCLLLSYAYYCTRMITTFDDVPNELFIGLLEASSLYALGAYLSSRTLHRELSANFKAKESSKEFKNFLKCVPEGVSIVDHEFMELKFYNSKLREAFDINRYCEFGAELAEFKDLKSSIDQEFSQALKKMAKNSCENSVGNKPFKSLMKKFKIIKESDIGSFEPSDEEDKNVEDQHGQPLLVKHQKLGSPEDKNLFEFLYQERETLKRENAKEKESKISLYFDDFNFIHGVEMSKREFVVKTRSVGRNDPESPNSSMYLHIFSDTTQITQLEEQKAQNRYQKQMLANVSHEFRTPLNAISLSLVLLKRKIGGPYAKFVKIASASCNILSFLVEDILDHAKIESGVFEIQPEVFKASKLIEEVDEIFGLQASEKRISLKFHVEKEIECIKIETDKQRIKQVMMNLLSNALKFTDRGEIKVFLERLIEDQNKILTNCFVNFTKMFTKFLSFMLLKSLKVMKPRHKNHITRCIIPNQKC